MFYVQLSPRLDDQGLKTVRIYVAIKISKPNKKTLVASRV